MCNILMQIVLIRGKKRKKERNVQLTTFWNKSNIMQHFEKLASAMKLIITGRFKEAVMRLQNS